MIKNSETIIHFENTVREANTVVTDGHFRNNIIQDMLISLRPFPWINAYYINKFAFQPLPSSCFQWGMLKWDFLIFCMVLQPKVFFKLKNSLLHRYNEWLCLLAKRFLDHMVSIIFQETNSYNNHQKCLVQWFRRSQLQWETY